MTDIVIYKNFFKKFLKVCIKSMFPLLLYGRVSRNHNRAKPAETSAGFARKEYAYEQIKAFAESR